jgi:hypothetical protein
MLGARRKRISTAFATRPRHDRCAKDPAGASPEDAPRLSNDWFTAIRASVQALDDRLAQAGDTPQAGELLEALRAVVSDAETQLATSERVFERLAAIGDDTENLKGAMSEMTRLEERMKTIIETGSTLVRRLQPEVG